MIHVIVFSPICFSSSAKSHNHTQTRRQPRSQHVNTSTHAASTTTTHRDLRQVGRQHDDDDDDDHRQHHYTNKERGKKFSGRRGRRGRRGRGRRGRGRSSAAQKNTYFVSTSSGDTAE